MLGERIARVRMGIALVAGPVTLGREIVTAMRDNVAQVAGVVALRGQSVPLVGAFVATFAFLIPALFELRMFSHHEPLVRSPHKALGPLPYKTLRHEMLRMVGTFN